MDKEVTTVVEAVESILPRFEGMEDVFERDEYNFAAFCHSQLSGGIGMKLRNEFGFWSSQSDEHPTTPLYTHMVEEVKIDPKDADAMSDHILRAVHKKYKENV